MKPTAKQLAYLRALARRTGETFAYARTAAQASEEISRLRQRQPSDRTERVVERRQVIRDMQERPREATRIRSDEVRGYGANCRWAGDEEVGR